MNTVGSLDVMVPLEGFTRRFIIFRVAVFPQPEDPNRTRVSPSAISIVRLKTATIPPRYDLHTFLKEIIELAFVSRGD